MPEVFIYSSNIGAAKMALEMGVDHHRACLKKLGLLNRVSTEIGESAAPIIPRIGRSFNTMTIAFGHGLSVTPLQLAAATVPLVNGGIAVRSTFLPRSREEGMSGGDAGAQARDQRGHAEADAPQRAEGHRQARRCRRLRVGGKTGTAEKVVGRHSIRPAALLTSFLVDLPDRRSRICRARYASMSRSGRGESATRPLPAPTPRPRSPARSSSGSRADPGVSPRREDDQRKFDAKVLASY